MRALNKDCGAAGSAPTAERALEVRIEGLKELMIKELQREWRQAWRAPPPGGARRRLLMLGIAWKWQADAFGGHSTAVKRRLAKLEADVRQGKAAVEENAPKPTRPQLMPGTRLLRVWKKQRHEVYGSCPGAWCRNADLRKGPSLIRMPRRVA